MSQSRAQLMGLPRSPKSMAGNTGRSLRSIRQRVEKLAEPWAEIDATMETARDKLIDAINEYQECVEDSVEYLEQRPDE